jgi:hypothetical protein
MLEDEESGSDSEVVAGPKRRRTGEKRKRITTKLINETIDNGGSLVALPAHLIHSTLYKLLKVGLDLLT